MRIAVWAVLAACWVLGGCADRTSPPATAVVAAVGEPESVLPPLAVETVARDIGDLNYERLADLAPAESPLDSSAYRSGLASNWERVDSLTWRFRLRPAATWGDGTPVTAEDVVFSFAAFADSALGSAAQPYLAGVRVEVDRWLAAARSRWPSGGAVNFSGSEGGATRHPPARIHFGRSARSSGDSGPIPRRRSTSCYLTRPT